MKYIRLSQLMAIGIKYIEADSTNTVVFNDGTYMTWKWTECVNDSGTDFSDMDFYCWKENEQFNVVDDVGFSIKREYPKRGMKESVWTKVFSEKECNQFLGFVEKQSDRP